MPSQVPGEPHIFLEPTRTWIPKPRPPGGFPPEYYHVDEEAIDLSIQIEETISNLEQKTLGDEYTYYIIDFYISINHPIVNRVIRRLNAKILAEINDTQILVTSTLENLKEVKNTIISRKTYYENIFSIHNLRIKDVVDVELRISEEFETPKTLTIHFVPNISVAQSISYMSQVIEYLLKLDVPILSSWTESDTGNSIIDGVFTRDQILNLTQQADFIYKIHEKINILSSEPYGEPVSFDFRIEEVSQEQIADLPEICVIDSGVAEIPQLVDYITGRHFVSPATDPEDNNNHGTSVATLAVYGDTIGNQSITHVPMSKVYSYKILEGRKSANIRISLSDSIETKPEIKIFNCSAGFTSSKLALTLLTQQVNSLVQRKNKILIFSAGNIEESDLRQIMSTGIHYPNYISNAPVFHPSDAPSVLSVGAITRLSRVSSLAPSDAPSPFTRCGSVLRELYDCIKPELVEHGGNLCFQNNRFNCTNVGVKTFENNGQIRERWGTSFSAPLVSQYSARVWDTFSSNISNSETVKAIVLSTCGRTKHHTQYIGMGIPDANHLFSSPPGVLRLPFEGSINLVETIEGSEVIPVDEIKLYVPSDISTIILLLVHSDDYQLKAFPSLNTYINVVTEKPGKRGTVKPKWGDPRSKTNVKKIIYRYQRNIKGTWFFRLIPRHINIPPIRRSQVNIRYGGVITLISKTPRTGLGASVLDGIKRSERTQIPINEFIDG